MIIIGIDPGYAITGWAVLDISDNKINPVDYGALETSKKEFHVRITEICSGLEKIIKKYKPEEAAIEKIYFSKNVKTAIDVAQVRGAIIITLCKKNIKIFDYTPLQVKQAVAGYGRAEKSQVQSMVKMLLNLDTIPKPDDVADAMAIGICHINSAKFLTAIKESRENHSN